MSAGRDITLRLSASRRGDAAALDEVFTTLYDELRRRAQVELGAAGAPPTLSATVIVHEVYLKLIGAEKLDVRDRRHFLALAARAMRQVLTDHARARLTRKRGSGAVHADIADVEVAADDRAAAVLELDAALDRLAALAPRPAEIVALRFFAGQSPAEVAEVLDISERTVRREWQKARALLHGALLEDDA